FRTDPRQRQRCNWRAVYHHAGATGAGTRARRDAPAPRHCPAHCTFVFGAGPFEMEEEARLLTDLRIDVVLARNIGGAGSYPKVAAARALDLPVILLEPSAWEFGPPLTALDDVVAWAAAL
ncbi:MAG: precorrin-6A/cobalt-precorrin-6A reductase, partial [Pseudomonadota bacterium]